MNFAESVRYLYSLGNEVIAMKLGLDNISRLLGALGNPESRYLKVQVAGTNGKGSVCAFLEAVCLEAGIRTGMTTSPHLISVTERIRIGGREISEPEFADLATRVRDASEELFAAGAIGSVPTYFEQVTAIALLEFAEAGVELAILETGLGGRFDAVTAARADLVALTPVGLDHQKILGGTVGLIAAEKAAIIRPDTPVVVGDQPAEALEVILEKCRAEGVVPVLADFPSEVRSVDGGFATVDFVGGRGYEGVRLGLAGRHQISNARVAIALAERLSERFGLPIGEREVRLGLAKARHRGRLERVGRFLLDGAHNEAGARALAEFLDEAGMRPVTVFGAMRDKDIADIAAILFPRCSHLVIAPPANERSMPAPEIARIASRHLEPETITECADVPAALTRAAEIAGDRTVLVTGSLYLIGEALAAVDAATARNR
jgi:dihydrofolate synthase/folylpolyglutamate synthase